MERDGLAPDVGLALIKLTRLGFRFEVAGGKLAWKHESSRKPDPATVRPLLDIVRTNKEAALFFLKIHCPRCGGIVFVGDECFLCDWLPRARKEAAQAQAPQRKALTCGGCAHFIPGRLNPAEGFGRCALSHLSKRPGAFPGKAACRHFEAPAGEGSLRLAQ
jgi:hypothetical protein